MIANHGLIFLYFSAYEPCKLGCNDLEFCTNFNNRPTSLFRSCNGQADNVARKEFQNWLLTKRPLSPQLQIPVKGWDFFYVHLIITRFIFNMNPFLHCLNHIAQHSMFAFLLGPFIKQAQARLGIFLMTNFSSEMTHLMKNNCSLL